MSHLLRATPSPPTVHNYMTLWIGLVGNVVGLSLPLTAVMDQSSNADVEARVKI